MSGVAYGQPRAGYAGIKAGSGVGQIGAGRMAASVPPVGDPSGRGGMPITAYQMSPGAMSMGGGYHGRGGEMIHMAGYGGFGESAMGLVSSRGWPPSIFSPG
jgi:hypothetical protein